VYAHGDDLLVVESQGHLVRRVAGGPDATWEIPFGYPRGIVTLDADRVLVGVSALRRESSSLGTANVLTSTSPLDFCTRVVELNLATGQIGRTVDLSLLGAEIFDLRALAPAARFVACPDRGLAQRVEALERSWREQRASRRALEQQLERAPAHRLRRLGRRLRRRFSAA
jgi:hypothetical protein